MKRIIAGIFAGIFAAVLAAAPAHAAPHYGNQLVASPAIDSLTVAGDIAGLGNQPEINMVLSATSDCGGPTTAQAAFPVTSGVTHYYVTVPAPCLAAVWSDVRVSEVISGITTTLPGTYQWHE